MFYPKYLVMQINSLGPVTFVVTLFFWACPVKRRHAKFIQTTKKVLAAQSQSAAAAGAGSVVGVEYLTNCRRWLSIRGSVAKPCRDIGLFSFQR